MYKTLIIAIILVSSNLLAQEKITIDASIDDGRFKNFTGFLHGVTNIETKPNTLDLIKKIKPKYWRNSDWNQNQRLANSLGANTTLVISDFYAVFKGGYAKAKPWLNWTEYESFVKSLITQYNNAGLSPNYWDIWNEPNDLQYWSGNLTQLVECFKRTRQIANVINPNIKLVGPSINSYNGLGIKYILDSLAKDGIKLNAVSWHEFGIPDSLGLHTNDFKSKSQLNPKWGNPEIHINEYSPKQTNQIPAFRLAWFYHLEQNNVNWANTACWENSDGTTNWSNCSKGLNGLFWYDEQSPLPVYWVNRAYAEIVHGKRIFCNRSDPKTLALSSKIDSTKEVKILIGRYYSIDNGTYLPTDIGKNLSNVSVTLKNYPYLSNGNVRTVIQRIPKGNLKYQNSPLGNPITIFNGISTVTTGTININLENFLDGDVYCVYLNPSAILGLDEKYQQNTFTLYPNPSNSEVTIDTERNINETLFLINTMGKVLKVVPLKGNHFVLDVSELSPGEYIIRIGDITKKIIKY